MSLEMLREHRRTVANHVGSKHAMREAKSLCAILLNRRQRLKEGGVFWGGKEYLIKTADGHITDAIGVLAYNHSAAINELQKALQDPANK